MTCARCWSALVELVGETDSRVLTALEQLDSAVHGAVADGRLSTDSVEGS